MTPLQWLHLWHRQSLQLWRNTAQTLLPIILSIPPPFCVIKRLISWWFSTKKKLIPTFFFLFYPSSFWETQYPINKALLNWCLFRTKDQQDIQTSGFIGVDVWHLTVLEQKLRRLLITRCSSSWNADVGQHDVWRNTEVFCSTISCASSG